MSVVNSSLLQKLSFVRPEYFFISGFSGIPYSKYYFIFLIFVYIVSVCGNSFVLYMILSNRSLHIPKYMGIFNLALSDFGETNALIPNLVKTFLFDSQSISYDACLANMFFIFFFAGGQSLTLAAMAYDRFIAICLPLRYHAIVNNSFMFVTLTAIWLFNIITVGTMVLLVTQLSFCKTNEVKSFFCDHGPVYKIACNDTWINSLMANVCIAIYLYAPLTAIVLSYIGILLALTKITTWEGRLKALKTCVSHLLIVGVFFLPVVSTYLAATISYLHPNARIINTSLSATIPPMLNPIIYVLNTKEFREFIMKILKKKNITVPQVQALEK
ncbi:putative gustatory receptor clone PTE03 [Tachysurus fulvidraco]|uniref:putative gustatory receptor clone PTE03 n=1 Tax=Tachysurus fulvidraco TaxID=1234273 RepID=UPI000F50AC63|nr:putative gustatory receptor clone PTE03 [Tachysurus fulvidraco]